MKFSTLVFICQIGLLVKIVIGQEVCYGELGCFPTGKPWSSLIRPVPSPQGPDVVKVFFLLYTRNNSETPFEIHGVNGTNWSVDGSYYDSQKLTIVFTHGYQDSTNSTWAGPMKNALLTSTDANVILVDYGSIINDNYLQAVSDIRIVAAQISNFLEYLIQEKFASPSRFYLAGLSLGAHISGYVGKQIPGILRITGLDAAQPLFEGQSPEVRLNKGDAEYIDAAHTNGGPLIGLGFFSPIGDVDFYFNGGWDQPGCTTNVVGLTLNGNYSLLNAIPDRFACPHLRARDYFIEAMGNPYCTFWGKRRTQPNALISIASDGYLSPLITPLSDCTIQTCTPFGQRTFDFPARGSFDIATAANPPYCINSTETDNLMEKLLTDYNSSN